MRFLRQVIGKNRQRIGDDFWQMVAANSVLQAAGTQPFKTYIDNNQAKVAEWVALRPIFEERAKDTG